MVLKKHNIHKHEAILRDVRPTSVRIIDALKKPDVSAIIFALAAGAIWMNDDFALFADLIFLFLLIYFIALLRLKAELPFKLPGTAKQKDKNNVKPGGGVGMAEGIMYIGNERGTNEEIWFNNTDARTHILYLGTTGSGKTEGLKSLSANALCWGSGFIYIDGKADTDLWSTISSMARKFGRDDDLLIMNYMTGGTGGRSASNTLNPFSSGSASYLVNMLVSLMPDAEGDNAMWKERAVALVSSLMPCLVYKRDKQNIPLSVSVIRKYLGFGDVIKLSRDESVPESMRVGVLGYLNELPGYVDDAFDDDGNEKPMPPDAPMVDTSVPRQQHGYLSMQFTRSLQSLGDDYGYIFDTQAADVDMMDVVLNRRILITLIPALEKSSDETANLGKIIASTLKGMMGSTLGHTVEGDTATAIENKPTNSSTPFVAIFDEVGYYTAAGMAVMAAQARSLGFCLVYAAQDLPALEKRVKEEARSITANCNIKLFGKLEDPTQTKDFFEKTVGQAMVTEVTAYTRNPTGMSQGYADSQQASVQMRGRAMYDDLRGFTEGRAIVAFGENVTEIQVYYSNPGHAKAMRVQRFLPLPPPGEDVLEGMKEVNGVLKRLRSKKWDPADIELSDGHVASQILAMADGFAGGKSADKGLVECSALAIAVLADMSGTISEEAATEENRPEDEPSLMPGDMEGGPVSWADVIGAGEGEGAGDTDEPVYAGEDMDEGGGEAAAGGGDAPMSWDSLVGEGEGEDESYSPERPPPVVEEAPPAPPQQEQPPAEQPQQQPATGAPEGEEEEELTGHEAAELFGIRTDEQLLQNDSLDAPMSWGDVVGVSTATAQQAAPEQPGDRIGDTGGDMSWEDVLQGLAKEENLLKPGDASEVTGPEGMNWGDVIGVSTSTAQGGAQGPADRIGEQEGGENDDEGKGVAE